MSSEFAGLGTTGCNLPKRLCESWSAKARFARQRMRASASHGRLKEAASIQPARNHATVCRRFV